MRKLKSN